MRKTLFIARHHFVKEVTKKSFLIVLLSMPFFLSLTVGLGFLFESIENDELILGYVDSSKFLQVIDLSENDEDIQLIPIVGIESARASLEAGDIDAYFVLPDDYPESIDVELFYMEEFDSRTYGIIRETIQENLLAGQPGDIRDLLITGANVTVRATEANREYEQGGPAAGLFVPVLGAIMFGFMTMTTSGYMLAVVVEEKENRTMEILLSSVSPSQMITGKIIGALGIAFLQLAIWSGFFILSIWLGSSVLNVAWLAGISPNYTDLVKLAVVALPAYLFMASVMTLVGATLVESTEAEQVGPMSFLVILIPLYVIVPIASDPNGPLAQILTYLPVTSVLTFALRSVFIEVAQWQVLTSFVIGLVFAGVTTWLAGKAFGMTLLRYGQRIRLRELFTRRSSQTSQVL